MQKPPNNPPSEANNKPDNIRELLRMEFEQLRHLKRISGTLSAIAVLMLLHLLLLAAVVLL